MAIYNILLQTDLGKGGRSQNCTTDLNKCLTFVNKLFMSNKNIKQEAAGKILPLKPKSLARKVLVSQNISFKNDKNKWFFNKDL